MNLHLLLTPLDTSHEGKNTYIQNVEGKMYLQRIKCEDMHWLRISPIVGFGVEPLIF
jgi:hypothetical protein